MNRQRRCGKSDVARLCDHQHVKHDHRRHAQDHGPDPECPENVFGTEALLFNDQFLLVIHDAPPRFFVVVGTVIREAS